VKDLAPSYLIDAGPLVGLFSLDDQWHEWSHDVLTALESPLATTELVWAEVCHHLTRDRASLIAAWELIEAGNVVLHTMRGDVRRFIAYLQKYPQMDSGDASLVLLSERFPKSRLITVDVRDFTIYRRFRDQPIPLIHP
jgi:uncharacterized protein